MVDGEEGGDNGLDDLAASVDDVVTAAVVTMRPVELAERAAELLRHADRLQAAAAQAISVASRAGDGPAAFRQGGCQDASQMVAIRRHTAKRSVVALARRGSWVTDFPVFADAWTDGWLSGLHLHELRGLDNPRTHRQLIDAQEYLVEAAQNCDWPEFRQVCAYWLLNADPDGAAPSEQVAKNRVNVRTRPDGSVTGYFRLDPLSGQVFTTALDCETQRLFRAEQNEDAGLRTSSQRKTDALVNLVIRGHHNAGAETVVPLVNVVMSKEVAENAIARLLDPTVPATELDGRDPDRRCEFADGTPVDPRIALAAFAVARFRRIVFDAKNKIVDASVLSRSFPPWMKHLLLIQARGRCRAPSCDAPFAWLQADHRKPHSRGGATNLTNGQMLCEGHNKWKRDHPDAA